MPNHNRATFTKVLPATLLAATVLVMLPSAWAAPADQAASTFQSTCTPCHGAKADGNTSMGKSLHVPDLHSPAIQKTPDAQLHQIISNGQGSMPPFAGRLSDAEIDALIAYIHHLPKPRK